MILLPLLAGPGGRSQRPRSLGDLKWGWSSSACAVGSDDGTQSRVPWFSLCPMDWALEAGAWLSLYFRACLQPPVSMATRALWLELSSIPYPLPSGEEPATVTGEQVRGGDYYSQAWLVLYQVDYKSRCPLLLLVSDNKWAVFRTGKWILCISQPVRPLHLAPFLLSPHLVYYL